MKLSLIKKKLAGINWYKQGVEAKCSCISYPWIAMNELTIFGRRIPVVYDTIICHARHNDMSWYWSRNSLLKVADYFYERHRKDSDFVHKLLKKWRSGSVKKLLHKINSVEEMNLESLSRKDFLEEFNLFSQAYMRFWRECALHDAFDIGGEIILENEIRKEKVRISKGEVDILIAMTELSWPQKEKKDFLRLVDLARKHKNWRKEELVQNEIQKHAEKYYWILNHYAGSRRLDEKYFSKEIGQYLKDRNKYHQDKETINHAGETKRKKSRLIKKLRLSKKFLADLDFIMTLARWRDERKTYVQMAGATITKFAKEFSRRTDLPMDVVENLFWPELARIFENKKHFAGLSKKRYKGVIILDYVRYNEGVYGRDAEELHKFLEKLISGGREGIKGRTAFPGIVQGVARIIKSPSEFHRMKRGDILIAPNTRPEYFPIMKIAGAIVTEEGGLTCHAAIVSRELKITCIVGAQGILSVVKDGDLVEVDADKGVVRIVGRK